MNRALLLKSWQETRLLFVGCALWLFAFCWVRVWIVSRMERSRFESILEQFGDLVETVSPVAISHLVSFTGRIAIAYDDALVVFVLLAFAISRGSDVVSGELGRGTLEMLLAQPVSRLQVLGSQAMVTVVGLALLSACTWAGTWAGIHTTTARVEEPVSVRIMPGLSLPVPFAKPKIVEQPMRTEVDPLLLAPASVNLFCLGLCFAGGTSLLSACDRYRWRTIGITLALLVIQMITKIVGMLVAGWGWLKFASVLSAYEPQRLVEIATTRPEFAWSFTMTASGHTVTGPLGYDAVLAGVGIVSYLIAALVFTQRDLPAPL
jgi:ABC-2 type transport system permease protein